MHSMSYVQSPIRELRYIKQHKMVISAATYSGNCAQKTVDIFYLLNYSEVCCHARRMMMQRFHGLSAFSVFDDQNLIPLLRYKPRSTYIVHPHNIQL